MNAQTSLLRATKLEFVDDQLCLYLEDGREIRTPVEFFPKLAHADPRVRNNFRIFGQGTGIEWPDLNEHLSEVKERILRGEA
jgi:hypothetical protein